MREMKKQFYKCDDTVKILDVKKKIKPMKL